MNNASFLTTTKETSSIASAQRDQLVSSNRPFYAIAQQTLVDNFGPQRLSRLLDELLF